MVLKLHEFFVSRFVCPGLVIQAYDVPVLGFQLRGARATLFLLQQSKAILPAPFLSGVPDTSLFPLFRGKVLPFQLARRLAGGFHG